MNVVISITQQQWEAFWVGVGATVLIIVWGWMIIQAIIDSHRK